MARKPGPGVCVHCLQEIQIRNWDHVFPKGWYPNTTPQNLEKWKIPTCKCCNNEYGKIEEDLSIVLSACIDPKSAHASGIWEKTLRALDTSKGKTKKDRKVRAQKREAVLSMMRKGDEIPDHGTYPGLGERWNRPKEEQTAIFVKAKDLQKLVEKIVKGLAYIKDGRLIDANAEITHHVIDEKGSVEIEGLLEKFGKAYSRGPGIKVIRAVTQEDGVSAFYKITIWGEIVLYASVIKERAQQ